jgi:tryptophan-rich sensory protein
MYPQLTAILVACAPALPTLVTMAACPVPKLAGTVVKARPPPSVFATVWPLLFLGLGVSFYRLECKWPILILSVLLAVWQVLYSDRCGNNPKTACWCLLLCSAVGLVALSFAACEADKLSIISLSCLVAWLLFAQNMNMLEVQHLS